MRARHPAWFREDLERLFGLLATGAIRPRVAERISFDEVAEAHRRLEAGGLEGKLVLCPDLPPRSDRAPSLAGNLNLGALDGLLGLLVVFVSGLLGFFDWNRPLRALVA